MFDLRGWTPPVDAGPFRFGPRDPARPLDDLSDAELRERLEHLTLRARDAWRAGEVPDPRLRRILVRVAARPDVRDFFTPEELRELGVGS